VWHLSGGKQAGAEVSDVFTAVCSFNYDRLVRGIASENYEAIQRVLPKGPPSYNNSQ
jgi:hypothetical protein